MLKAATAALLVVVACSTPTYHFVKEAIPHCSNHTLDADLGESDVDCGGIDCKRCDIGAICNEPTDCGAGQCIGNYCQEPGCSNKAQDPDETGVDCGGSCPPCGDGQPCDSGVDCTSKVCGDDGLCATATCMDGVLNNDENAIDCGGSSCDGCGVGKPCDKDGQCESGKCVDGTCALNCSPGTKECDGDLNYPCETNTLTSIRNCGDCGQNCELSNAYPLCVGGACQIDSCVAPFIRCDVNDSNGCEINASTDEANCGGCGIVCPDLHGTPKCVSSKCTIACDDGFGDCDNDPLTGCEASITDVDNCGKCGRKCPENGGEPYCKDGKCGVTVCDAGKGDCDGDQVCEADLTGDPYNCGRCGHVCTAANGTAACVNSVCVVTKCDNGYKNCDASADNGCETNIASDPHNCGDCDAHCDMLANGTGSCQAGNCAIVCSAGFKDCDGRVQNGCESDTTSDPDNCGGCGHPCDVSNATAACQNSTCVIDRCNTNFADCTAADGCETDTSSNVQHCGSCTGTCSKAGATNASCSNGKCDPPTCDSGHRNCDGKNENGCETDVTTPSACGACGNVCDSSMPNCVLSGTSYKCQAKISIANAVPYPTAQTASNTLSFSATPHAGTNRLILIAIAAESQNNGLAGARPDSVKFNGMTMTAGPSQVGANDYWSPDLFIYYLPLGDSASDESSVSVTIDGSSSPAETAIMMQDLQLNGVRQTSPLTASAGAFLGTTSAEAPDPSTIPLTLAVGTSGSAFYSFISAMWMDGGNCSANTTSSNCPTWGVSPSTNLTATETWASTPLSVAGTPMRTFGMFVTAPSPSLPAAGTPYQTSWTIPYSGRMTHLAVTIAPAQSP